MTFRRVNNFNTDQPAKLSRELSTMEDNVTAEFTLLKGQLAPLLQAVTFTATPTRGIVAMLADQQLSIDTSLASGAVVLPALDPRNFGRRFVVLKRVAPNSVVVSCQDPAVKCNGVAFPTLAAIGATYFLCDSAGYYK